MTPSHHIAAIIAGQYECDESGWPDEWEPDDADEYRRWLEERDDECADERDAAF